VLHVLVTDVKSLTDDSATDLLVHLDTNRVRSNIPDDASSTLVHQVRHALVLRRINFDVNVVSNLRDMNGIKKRIISQFQ